jgi:hypothetical protein
VLRLTWRVSNQIRLESKAFGKGGHKQALGVFAKSKKHVGLSENYGIGTSILEARAMGALPMKTSTAYCDELFRDSGVAVHHITDPAVKVAIKDGLTLVEEPANSDRNLETIKCRVGAEMVKQIAQKFYDQGLRY